VSKAEVLIKAVTVQGSWAGRETFRGVEDPGPQASAPLVGRGRRGVAPAITAFEPFPAPNPGPDEVVLALRHELTEPGLDAGADTDPDNKR